jgi:hypothetical protein
MVAKNSDFTLLAASACSFAMIASWIAIQDSCFFRIAPGCEQLLVVPNVSDVAVIAGLVTEFRPTWCYKP